MKTPRSRRNVFALAIGPAFAGVCLLASALCSPATPFYTYTIAARTGVDLDGSGAVAFMADNLDPVSMNDSGMAALIGQIFLDDGQVVAFYGELKPDKTKQITLQNGDVVPLPNILKPSVQAA